MQGKILAFAFMLFAGMLSAQVEAPAPSPMGKIEQKVGLTDVTIEYSRPGMKNRVIFGDLVPYDQMWRTGANASTKITFSDDVTVGGVALKKGTYALYAVPGETEWEFVFYKDLTHWGVPKEWDATQEAARFMVESEEIPWTVETMSFDINNLRDESARVNLMWESTLVGFDIGVSTDDKVMASIEKTLAGPGRGDYYNAAKYYYTAEKDLDDALAWVRKANEIEEKFWQLRLQSLIEAKLGDKTTAISTATKSMMLAEKAGYDNYVRMNKASIAEWSAEGAEEDSEVPEGED